MYSNSPFSSLGASQQIDPINSRCNRAGRLSIHTLHICANWLDEYTHHSGGWAMFREVLLLVRYCNHRPPTVKDATIVCALSGFGRGYCDSNFCVNGLDSIWVSSFEGRRAFIRSIRLDWLTYSSWRQTESLSEQQTRSYILWDRFSGVLRESTPTSSIAVSVAQ